MKDLISKHSDDTRFGGENWKAATDSGTEVIVWVPKSSNPGTSPLHKLRHNKLVQRAHELIARGDEKVKIANFRGKIFCHGHSLGTYNRYGYSVYGDYMETVLKDEYTQIINLTSARAGDIIVWWRNKVVVHSALLEIVPMNNAATTGNIKISSKDTFSGFSHEWMNKYLKDWGNDYKIYRKV